MRASLPYLLSAIICFTSSTVSSPAHATQLAEAPLEQNAAEEVTRVFVLKHLEADTALQIFQAIYESDARLKVEPRSNSLVFRGSVSDEENLSALLEDLESRAAQAKPKLPAGPQSLSIDAKAGGQPVAELRQQYRELDQQCLELAASLRNKGEVQKQSQQSLGDLVERVFDARQQLQRAEIADNVRRLLKIQQTLETREGLKTQIVQRRAQELLNPDVDWRNDVGGHGRRVLEKMQPNDPTGKADRAVAAAREEDPLLEQGNPSPSVGRPSQAVPSLTGTDLLRISPTEMRELLRKSVGSVIDARKFLAMARSKPQKDDN